MRNSAFQGVRAIISGLILTKHVSTFDVRLNKRNFNFLFDIMRYISPNQYVFLESCVFFSDSFNYL
jgi:hypothetical protein